VADLNPARLAFVRDKLGIPDTIEISPAGQQAALAQLRELTGGRMADVVVDATGSHHSMSAAPAWCAFAGRLVYVGITQAEVGFPHAPVLHRRELTILASRNALARDFTRIISLIETAQIDTTPWLTHHARFDSLIDIFPTWLDPESGVIKAVVELA
jgi:alcohol dehydrogenase